MTRNFRRIVSMLLAMVMLLALVPTTVFALNENSGGKVVDGDYKKIPDGWGCNDPKARFVRFSVVEYREGLEKWDDDYSSVKVYGSMDLTAVQLQYIISSEVANYLLTVKRFYQKT